MKIIYGNLDINKQNGQKLRVRIFFGHLDKRTDIFPS
jgi:hypothetical protein